MDVYLLATGALKKPKDVRSAIILSCTGPQVIGNMHDQLDIAEGEDKKDPQIVMNKLELACSGKEIEVLQTYHFWKISMCVPDGNLKAGGSTKFC